MLSLFSFTSCEEFEQYCVVCENSSQNKVYNMEYCNNGNGTMTISTNNYVATIDIPEELSFEKYINRLKKDKNTICRDINR